MSNCWINEPDTTCTEHGRHISNCSNIHASEVDKLKALLKIAAKGYCGYECHWNERGSRMVHCSQCRELKRACK